MRRYLVLALMAALAAAGCSSHSDSKAAPKPGVEAGLPTSSSALSTQGVKSCDDIFVDGKTITANDAKTETCNDLKGELFSVITLDCVDHTQLIHPATGWGIVGQPFHHQTKSDGGIPDDAYNTCTVGS